MILHCERCSLGGTNIGPHSAIAKIDFSKLGLPLRADAFEGLYGGQVWGGCCEWNHMYCPRANGAHLVFMVDYDKTGEALERGGPESILTDMGRIYIADNEHDRMMAHAGEPRGNRSFQAMPRVARCPKCGKPETEFKTKAGFVNHCRLCKK